MNRALDVYLYGVHAATLTRRGDNLNLRYVPAYVDSIDPVPISVSLPVVSGAFPSTVTRKFLENLLPDRADVRSRWAREAKLDSDSAFDLLSVYGADVAGALEFYPQGGTPRRDLNLSAVTDAEIGARIREIRRDDSAWNHDRDVEQGFSLGGAQGKFALTLKGDQWFEASGAHPSTHIFKPGIFNRDNSDITEYITINIAREFLLQVPNVTVAEYDGEHVLIVERFDRLVSSEGITRVHQEDLAQATNTSYLRKYESDNGPSYKDFFDLFDRALSVMDAQLAKISLAHLLVFSWIIGHNDGHAKNYSLIHLPGRTVLAPFYDLNSALPFIPPNQVRANDPTVFHNIGLALSVNGANTLGSFNLESISCLEVDTQLSEGHLVAYAQWVATELQSVTNRVIATLPDEIQSLDEVKLYPFATFTHTRHVKSVLGI